jgi:decaprenyl-phosphate phosphoribosyltransferase
MEYRTTSTEERTDGFRPVAGTPPPPPAPGTITPPPGEGADPTESFPAPPGPPSSRRWARRLDPLIPPADPRNPFVGLVRTARPKQWTKNLLVIAAPGAAGVLFHGRPFLHTLAAFALFCAVSSGTYMLNDAIDAPADRLHPVKRLRPVAAGLVTERQAVVTAGALMGAGIALGAALRLQLALVLAIYAVLQIAYSTYLKRLPVYDITCVAGGFLLRAIAGAVAIPVAVSEWFLIVTTFGSLLMVTGKRLAEHAELGDGRAAHRASLDSYSLGFLRIVVAIAATGAVVGYSLWAFGLEAAAVAVHHHDGIFFQLSIIPVLLALLHFTMLIEQGKGARPEELVLGDRQLQLLGLIWLLLFALGVYG